MSARIQRALLNAGENTLTRSALKRKLGALTSTINSSPKPLAHSSPLKSSPNETADSSPNPCTINVKIQTL